MRILEKSGLDPTPDTPILRQSYQQPESSTSVTDSASTALKFKEHLLSICKQHIESAFTTIQTVSLSENASFCRLLSEIPIVGAKIIHNIVANSLEVT